MGREFGSDIVAAELDQAGVEYTTNRGREKAHRKYYFKSKGRKWVFTCSRRGTTPQGIRNTRAGIRRLMREAGLL